MLNFAHQPWRPLAHVCTSMPAAIAPTKIQARPSSTRASIAGPGQKPTDPHPTPKSRAPIDQTPVDRAAGRGGSGVPVSEVRAAGGQAVEQRGDRDGGGHHPGQAGVPGAEDVEEAEHLAPGSPCRTPRGPGRTAAGGQGGAGLAMVWRAGLTGAWPAATVRHGGGHEQERWRRSSAATGGPGRRPRGRWCSRRPAGCRSRPARPPASNRSGRGGQGEVDRARPGRGSQRAQRQAGKEQQVLPPGGRRPPSSPANRPLMPATRPLASISTPAASPISTPPSAARPRSCRTGDAAGPISGSMGGSLRVGLRATGDQKRYLTPTVASSCVMCSLMVWVGSNWL